MLISDPSVVFNMVSLYVMVYWKIKPSLAFELIALLFGEEEVCLSKLRALTEIERVIIARIGQQMLNISKDVWANVLGFNRKLHLLSQIHNLRSRFLRNGYFDINRG